MLIFPVELSWKNKNTAVQWKQEPFVELLWKQDACVAKQTRSWKVWVLFLHGKHSSTVPVTTVCEGSKPK